MLLTKRKNNKDEKGGKKGERHNPKILDVNLIKDELRVSFDWSRNLSVLLIILFITGLFVVEIYFGLSWWEDQETLRAQILNESVAEINQEINALQTQASQALRYKDKTVEVNNLLKNHIYWTDFFSWLERNTLSTVSFSNFSGDLSGIYSLDAKAQTFADASWQAKALLDDPATKKVEISAVDASLGDDEGQEREVNFIINLELNPAIFKR